ncbi:MAG: AAA family ATPase [Promethearchaeota archaeon]
MEISDKAKKLLIVVGMAGCGKSVVVDYFNQKNWQVIYFGGVTMNEVKKRNLPVNQINEKMVREELRQIHGMEAYAKLEYPNIKKALSQGLTIIDGLYSWSEYKFLRENINIPIIILAVYTPKKLRYERLLKRKFRGLDYKQAELRDFAEIENLEKGGPIAIADQIIVNDGSIEKLHSDLDKFLNDFNSEKI